MKKRILSAVLAVVMMFSLLTSAWALGASDFSDLEAEAWYYEHVDNVIQKGYMNGMDEDEFWPAGYLSRAMAVVVLARVAEVKVDNNVDSVFTDVPNGDWYTGAVVWANGKNIVNGQGDNKFGSASNIMRQDAATIIARFLDVVNYKKPNVDPVEFIDFESVREYAKEAVLTCAELGIINGYEDDSFRPEQWITRAEFAAMIDRLSELLYKAGIGGGGGYTPVATNDYKVTATLEIPDGILDRGNAFDLEVLYEDIKETGANDKTIADAAFDLVTTDENKTAIDNAIVKALNKAKGVEKTQTIKGREVTVAIDNNGVITATIEGGLGDFTSDSNGPLENPVAVLAIAPEDVTLDNIEALIEKLNSAAGGNVTLTEDDLVVLEKAMDKAKEIVDPAITSDEELQKKIDSVISEDPDLADLANGITLDEVRSTAADYQVSLNDVKTTYTEAKAEAEAAGKVFTGEIEAPAAPIVMTIDVNLVEYVQLLDDKYFDNFTEGTDENGDAYGIYTECTYFKKAVEKFKSASGIDLTTDEYADAYLCFEWIYYLAYPGWLVDVTDTDEDGTYDTVTLQTPEAYYEYIADIVAASCDFWKALAADQETYQKLIDAVGDKASDNGIGYGYANLASILGATDGFLVDYGDTNGMIFEVSGTPSTIINVSSFGNAYDSQILDLIEDTIYNGEYTLTVAVNEVTA